jgi:transcriptional regulator with XRE-family HTH domain
MRNSLARARPTRNSVTHEASSNSRNHRMPLRKISVGARQANSDREVVRCEQGCGLVQFRTRSGFCRRCLRLLPCILVFRTPTPAPAVEEAALPVSQSSLVENIGRRISELREAQGLTQAQLTNKSRVSRSYISRIESGKMLPSISTLEKVGAALGIGLNTFFVPETGGSTLLEDKFILAVHRFLHRLKHEQWKSIMVRLRAISGHVESEQIESRTAKWLVAYSGEPCVHEKHHAYRKRESLNPNAFFNS